MPNPSTIAGLRPEEQDLLEAAGWADPKVLAGASPVQVQAELERANDVLNLAEQAPDLERVRGWIEWACEAMGVAAPSQDEEPEAATVAAATAPEPEPDLLERPAREVALRVGEDGAVDYESDPEVQAMIGRAPLAIPIENRALAAHGISPSEISVAPVLSHADSDLELRVTAAAQHAAVAAEPRKRMGRAVTKGDRSGGDRVGIDASRVKSLDVAKEERGTNSSRKTEVVPAAPAAPEQPVNLLRTPRESTNRGRKPTSKSYIRGVLHDRPVKVWFGCLIVLLFQVAMPLGVAAAPLLILSKNLPDTFGWVPKWFLVFPLLVPVFGLLYFLVCIGVKCRVCGQKILVPRHCRKNVKAHHIPGLGYIMPTALHTLVYRWFNCTFCGTAVRIKE